MRLIDADIVLKTIKMVTDPTVATDVLEHIIATTPTAFDVEEVLGHLQSEHDKWTKGVEQVQAMGLDELRRNLSGRAFGISEAIKIIEIEKMNQQLKFWPLELDNVIKARWNND